MHLVGLKKRIFHQFTVLSSAGHSVKNQPVAGLVENWQKLVPTPDTHESTTVLVTKVASTVSLHSETTLSSIVYYLYLQ